MMHAQGCPKSKLVWTRIIHSQGCTKSKLVWTRGYKSSFVRLIVCCDAGWTAKQGLVGMTDAVRYD